MHATTPAPPVHLAGNTSISSAFERFQLLRPPTFAGTHRPEEAKYWLYRISKMLKPLHCTEVKHVDVLRTVAAGYVWTWDAFKTRFNEKYFPFTYHNEEGEFLHLRQRGMTVAEYENKFTELASIPNYAELVSMSLRAEQDGDSLSRTCAPVGPQPRPDFPTRPFLGKRPCADSPSRLATSLTQLRRADLRCDYYGRTGHTERYCFSRMRDNGFSPPQRINR
ncbi:uncharacterized protein LOC131224288 [Magnolia sinica]|uniref:uncharacterized protein LOC131224288 n=1 Tax=Magnolia sinica TaxID=86752 RepID=UPI002658E90E|nr:uncharacterized protein LOC131224288 [Magnolia sinica]